MIEPVKYNPSTPVLLQHKKKSSTFPHDTNDILAPMKRFKKELPVPSLGEQPDLSLRKVRIRQKEFYSHRGQVYEKLQNTQAAIASYQKATYYEPSDTNIFNQIKRLKIQNLTNIKA
ncbi:MAG: tetratricopeptide repeat protein [Spirochaetes bacterium]|nr:tetratricopeptide repeat protein [Spirochaetota bacterium]